MNLPDWMPPLPDVSSIAYYDGQEKLIHAAIRNYAEQYRKAWLASLKPVAWMTTWASFHMAPVGSSTPLYRLD